MDTRKIKLLVGVGGVDFSWHPGQVVELPADEAEGWADGERAVYADPSDEERAADVERLGELLTEALAERDALAAQLAAATAERDEARAQLEALTAPPAEPESTAPAPEPESTAPAPEPESTAPAEPDDAKAAPTKATKSTPAKAGK